MGANDVKPTRLAAARGAARAFLDELPKKYRVGVSASRAAPTSPLPPTDDRDLARRRSRILAPGRERRSATRSRSRPIVGDGSEPPTAQAADGDARHLRRRADERADDAGRGGAAAHGRRTSPVYSVLIGTQDGVVNVPLAGGFQAQMRVPPSPQTLQLVARSTGGRFIARRHAAELRQVYERLGSRLGIARPVA